MTTNQYTAAILELRQFLADSPTKKRASRKAVLGNVDGVNTLFRTFDKNIVIPSFQVYIGNDLVDATLDDPIAGEFTMATAPTQNTKITASYYWQWWTDDELKDYLNKGAESIGIETTTTPDTAYLGINPGLKTATLYLASFHAQNSLIQYMMNRKHSGEFLLEQDKNDDAGFAQVLSSMQKQADQYWKSGMALRDDFYKKQGRQFKPAIQIKVGTTRRYGPMR